MQLRPKPIVLHVNRQVQRETAFPSTVLGPESYPCDGMNFAYKKILLISVDGMVGLPVP